VLRAISFDDRMLKRGNVRVPSALRAATLSGPAQSSDANRPSITRNGHRNGPGVIGVVIVRRAGGQQPDPGAELGLDINDPLPGDDELRT